MLALREQLGQLAPGDWSSSDEHCAWCGVVCNGAGEVEGIGLLGLSAAARPGATFPGPWCGLPTLQVLAVVDSPLAGPVPASVFRLPNLCALLVKYTSVTALPALGAADVSESRLRQIHLTDNADLSGPVPAWLWSVGASSNFVQHVVDLSSNALTGFEAFSSASPAPSHMLVSSFTACCQQLGGSLPTDLFSASGILWAQIDLHSNRLSGPLLELNRLNYLTAFAVDVADNQFTGAIPSTWASLSALEVLNVSRNQLTSVPEALFTQLGKLEHLDLSYNAMIVPFPSSINLPSLVSLNVSSATFYGQLPAFSKTMLQLSDFSMCNEGAPPPVPGGAQGTTLYGGILDAFGTLPLRTIRICNPPFWPNVLLASVPGALFALEELVVSSTFFLRGLLTIENDQWPRLRVLDLHGTGLRGRLPAGLGTLGALEDLDLSSTYFFGSGQEVLSLLPRSLKSVNLEATHLGALPSDSCSVLGIDARSCRVVVEQDPLVDRERAALHNLTQSALDAAAPPSPLWNRSEDPCRSPRSWPGVLCSASGYVTSLDWGGRRLGGRLAPGVLNVFTRLQALNLSSNAFHSDASPLDGELFSATDVDLSHNRIGADVSDLLPPLISSGKALFASASAIRLSSNRLRGDLAAFLQLLAVGPCLSSSSFSLPLAGLRVLDLSSNLLTLNASLPDASVRPHPFLPPVPVQWAAGIRAFTSLEELSLAGNALGGPSPQQLEYDSPALKAIGDECALRRTTAACSDVYPCLPSLRTLDISNCSLHGGVPGSFLGWALPEALETLNLGGNELSGRLPPELGRFTKLRRLSLEANPALRSGSRLSGPLPALQALRLRGTACACGLATTARTPALQELDMSAVEFEGAPLRMDPGGGCDPLGGSRQLRALSLRGATFSSLDLAAWATLGALVENGLLFLDITTPNATSPVRAETGDAAAGSTPPGTVGVPAPEAELAALACVSPELTGRAGSEVAGFGVGPAASVRVELAPKLLDFSSCFAPAGAYVDAGWRRQMRQGAAVLPPVGVYPCPPDLAAFCGGSAAVGDGGGRGPVALSRWACGGNRDNDSLLCGECAPGFAAARSNRCIGCSSAVRALLGTALAAAAAAYLLSAWGEPAAVWRRRAQSACTCCRCKRRGRGRADARGAGSSVAPPLPRKQGAASEALAHFILHMQTYSAIQRVFPDGGGGLDPLLDAAAPTYAELPPLGCLLPSARRAWLVEVWFFAVAPLVHAVFAAAVQLSRRAWASRGAPPPSPSVDGEYVGPLELSTTHSRREEPLIASGAGASEAGGRRLHGSVGAASLLPCARRHLASALSVLYFPVVKTCTAVLATYEAAAVPADGAAFLAAGAVSPPAAAPPLSVLAAHPSVPASSADARQARAVAWAGLALHGVGYPALVALLVQRAPAADAHRGRGGGARAASTDDAAAAAALLAARRPTASAADRALLVLFPLFAELLLSFALAGASQSSAAGALGMVVLTAFALFTAGARPFAAAADNALSFLSLTLLSLSMGLAIAARGAGALWIRTLFHTLNLAFCAGLLVRAVLDRARAREFLCGLCPRAARGYARRRYAAPHRALPEGGGDTYFGL